MAENIINKIKEIWAKIVAWWQGYTSKQKTVVIAIGAAVVVALVILYAVISAPNYVVLQQCDSTKEASEITGILDADNIPWKASDDGLQIKVPQKNLSQARLSLGGSGIVPTGYTIEDALNGSFTTTEADKQKKYKLYREETFENDFVNIFPAIKACTVQLDLPENDGTLLSKNEKAGAAIYLSLEGDDFTSDNAASLAKMVATVLNTDLNKIRIMSSDGTMLFSEDDSASVAGNASTQLGVKQDAENILNAGVRRVLGGTGAFGDIRVTSNLVIDFSSSEITDHQYTPAEGQSQGLLSEEQHYTEESSGGTSGAPGTDSNGETTHYFQDNGYSSSTIEELYKKYVPNERIEYTQIPAGKISYAASSLAVSSTNFIIIKEEDVKAQGLLDGISWDEYKLANVSRKQVPMDPEMLSLASDASGIPEENITILAYEENFFVDAEKANIDIYDIIQVVLIVLILGLLALVVIKSMAPEKVEEQPEELSVETLLQSNPEEQLENIELETVSETRRMIEKFVDENPEAVANLLRNWLNEGWE